MKNITIEVDIEDTPCCEELNEEGRQGYRIDLTKLPKGVKILRFYNSW